MHNPWVRFLSVVRSVQHNGLWEPNSGRERNKFWHTVVFEHFTKRYKLPCRINSQSVFRLLRAGLVTNHYPLSFQNLLDGNISSWTAQLPFENQPSRRIPFTKSAKKKLLLISTRMIESYSIHPSLMAMYLCWMHTNKSQLQLMRIIFKPLKLSNEFRFMDKNFPSQLKCISAV